MAPPRKSYTVSAVHGLNVREAASYDAAVLHVLRDGEAVKAETGKPVDGWMQLKGGGFVRVEYIK